MVRKDTIKIGGIYPSLYILKIIAHANGFLISKRYDIPKSPVAGCS
jgi:hypothetical protein